MDEDIFNSTNIDLALKLVGEFNETWHAIDRNHVLTGLDDIENVKSELTDLSEIADELTIPEIEGCGGAIYVAGNGAVINDSSISYTNASKGGAIYISGSNSIVNWTDFRYLNASGDGGTIYISGIGGKLHNSNFTDIFAVDNGGAIYWMGDKGDIYNIICKDIRAPSVGSDDPDVHVSSSKGGTICLTGNDVNVTKAIFNQSYAGVDGGAMFITGNNVDVTASEFYSCHVNLTRLDP